MCGRYWLSDSPESICNRYNATPSDLEGYTSAGEIFPSDTVPVVIHDNKNCLMLMKWGFPNPVRTGLIINARSETIDIKNMFRNLFATQRCIIPANAYFEWKSGGEGKVKYRIGLRGADLISLAGIYGDFNDNKGGNYTGFVIITAPPHPLIADIHNRMPVIITGKNENKWLDSEVRDISCLKGILSAHPSEYEGLTTEPI